MTDIPNDKKLSERFAEAIDGVTFHGSAADYETLGALSYRNSKDLLDALTDVIAERLRQVSEEGWTAEHDDEHKSGEMALAASAYAEHAARFQNAESVGMIYATKSHPSNWPWHRKWWKPKDYRRDLVRAGALIIAEIERLDRARTALATINAALGRVEG